MTESEVVEVATSHTKHAITTVILNDSENNHFTTTPSRTTHLDKIKSEPYTINHTVITHEADHPPGQQLTSDKPLPSDIQEYPRSRSTESYRTDATNFINVTKSQLIALLTNAINQTHLTRHSNNTSQSDTTKSITSDHHMGISTTTSELVHSNMIGGTASASNLFQSENTTDPHNMSRPVDTAYSKGPHTLATEHQFKITYDNIIKTDTAAINDRLTTSEANIPSEIDQSLSFDIINEVERSSTGSSTSSPTQPLDIAGTESFATYQVFPEWTSESSTGIHDCYQLFIIV